MTEKNPFDLEADVGANTEENPFDLEADVGANTEENPFDLSEQEEEERPFGRARDIGRGLAAAPITLVQGITEAGAIGLDLAFDTDYARRTSEGFESFKERVGASPTGTAGKVTEELTAFGLGFLPIAGWLGRASAAARSGAAAGAAPTSFLHRTADAFGRSELGRRLLKTNARRAGTTAVAVGGFEAVVSPDGYGTVADAFDFMPSALRTEEGSEDIVGRENALRLVRNRGRRAFEAMGFSAAVDTALIAAPRVGEAAMAVPGVAPAVGASLRGGRAAFDTAAQAIGRVPGAKTSGEFFQRWFSPGGGIDPRIYEENIARMNFPQQALRESLSALRGYEQAVHEVHKAAGFRGLGRAGNERLERDFFQFLTGGNMNALDAYPESVREAASRMQRLVYELEDSLLKITDDEILRYGVSGPVSSIGETTGLAQLRSARDAVVRNRETARIQREAIREAREAAGLSLVGFEEAQSTFLRRSFERYQAPERFYGNLDPKFMEQPTFKNAVEEVMRNGGLDEDAARARVLHYMGLDMLADGRVTPEAAIADRLKAIRSKKASSKAKLFAEGSDMNIVQGLYAPREKLLDQSDALRELLRENVKPEELFVRTMEDLATTVANVRFANSLADPASGFVRTMSAAADELAEGGRPMFVDPGTIRGGLPQATARGQVRQAAVERRQRDPVTGRRRRVEEGQTEPQQVQLTSEEIAANQALLESYGYAPLGAVEGTHPFMGVYGALSGMYAPPEMHTALSIFGRLSQGLSGELYGLAGLAKAYSQNTTVILNPASQMRNFKSAFDFLAANANLGRETDFTAAYKATAANIRDLDDYVQRKFMREMGQLGIVDKALATSLVRQLKDMGKDLNFAGKVQRAVDRWSDNTPFFGRVNTFMNSTYSQIDTFTKIANTISEESKLATALSRAGLDDTSDVVKQIFVDNKLLTSGSLAVNPDIPMRRIFAAQRTTENLPTYDRIPKGLRVVDSTAFFGAFASFASENIRNGANTLMSGLRGMAFTVNPSRYGELGQAVVSSRAAQQAVARETPEGLEALGRTILAQQAVARETPQSLETLGRTAMRERAAAMTPEALRREGEQIVRQRAVEVDPAQLREAGEEVVRRNAGEEAVRNADSASFESLGREAAQSLERSMRGQGAARTASFMTVAGMKPVALSRMSARAVGMSEEDEAAALSEMPFYLAGHPLIYLDFKRTPEGPVVEYIDQSYVNPYAFLTDGARAALREYQERGALNQSQVERIAAGMWSGLTSYAEPFGTESLVFERLLDVLPGGWVGRGGRTRTGAAVYLDSEDLGTKMKKGMYHMLGGFIPGYANETVVTIRAGEPRTGRLYRTAAGIPSPQGIDYDPFAEGARLVSGYTPMVLDMREQMAFSGAEYSSLRTSARGMATREIRRPDASPERMINTWGQYLDDLYRHQSALYASVLAAEQLGMSERAIIQRLMNAAKLGRDEAALITRGMFVPSFASDELIRDLKLEERTSDRTRVTPDPPWREFQRLTRERFREPLSPAVGRESQEERYSPLSETLRRSGTESLSPDQILDLASSSTTQVPGPQAPQTPAPPQAPPQATPQPIQPAPAPQAAAPSPARQSPGLLGTNPMDILRNMELAQRTGGG